MSDYYPPKGGQGEPVNEGQPHLAEPKHLKPDDPGPCPRPPGCTCVWTPGSLDWFHGKRKGCPVH